MQAGDEEYIVINSDIKVFVESLAIIEMFIWGFILIDGNVAPNVMLGTSIIGATMSIITTLIIKYF